MSATASRRLYNNVAKSINDIIYFHNHDTHASRIAQDAVAQTARHIAVQFHSNDPAFNTTRFFAACGVSPSDGFIHRVSLLKD